MKGSEIVIDELQGGKSDMWRQTRQQPFAESHDDTTGMAFVLFSMLRQCGSHYLFIAHWLES